LNCSGEFEHNARKTMPTESLLLNQIVVFSSAAVYWAGVWVQARRIRRRIGRSTNSRPRGPKERLLWAGWFFVVVAWLALPFLCAPGQGRLPGTAILPVPLQPLLCALGVTMVVAGYAGTLWCYVAMGNAWRMGVNRAEKTDLVTRGPYGFVRHPIYLFQVIMAAAIPLLLPSVLAFAILAIHVLCVRTKAADEESHLRTLLGRPYEAYCARTGRWLPRLRRRKIPESPSPAVERDSLKSAEHPLK
jgi:protein-S-isoprenylcysteine O-methyltransferase Ste14